MILLPDGTPWRSPAPTQATGRIRSIYQALRRMDERWGRLEHRLVAIKDGAWAWTCPSCRKDHIYSPQEDIAPLVLEYDGCCQRALRGQFPPESDPAWAEVWRLVDEKQQECVSDGDDPTEEPVRPGEA